MTVNEVVTGILSIISALSAAGVFAAVKSRADAKKISNDGHAETHRLLVDLLAEQKKTNQTLRRFDKRLTAVEQELHKFNTWEE